MGILFMLIYAIIVGIVAKLIMPNDAPVGLLSTICVGVAGTYVGGFINWAIGAGRSPFETSGIIMGIVGGVIALAIWRWYNLQFSVTGPRSFWTGEKKW
jgi:uncharacterized membrane protein YeaQ/YmgE (transglycosylase-associated protein family)